MEEGAVSGPSPWLAPAHPVNPGLRATRIHLHQARRLCVGKGFGLRNSGPPRCALRAPGTQVPPSGAGSTNSGAVRLFRRARETVGKTSTARLVRSAAQPPSRVPLDGVRWTEAPWGPVLSWLGAHARGQGRYSRSGSCGTPVPRKLGSDRHRRGPGCRQSLPVTAEPFAPRPGPLREPFSAVPAAPAVSLPESQRVSSFSPPREGTKKQKEFR